MPDMSEEHGPAWPTTRLVHSAPRRNNAPVHLETDIENRLHNPAFNHLTTPHWSHVKGIAYGKAPPEDDTPRRR